MGGNCDFALSTAVVSRGSRRRWPLTSCPQSQYDAFLFISDNLFNFLQPIGLFDVLDAHLHAPLGARHVIVVSNATRSVERLHASICYLILTVNIDVPVHHMRDCTPPLTPPPDHCRAARTLCVRLPRAVRARTLTDAHTTWVRWRPVLMGLEAGISSCSNRPHRCAHRRTTSST